ncbi:MAG: TadE/TadG family type IV pilus assembly protein [Actinomyces sp.]|uniref:TadE/TadG family type IV pilus assembly protein n=1 Tax=Actinomyces sp. TaxID=29317 RepID=UPI0026DCAEB2|nr:TadE/TadG family type IV pilus assembly protein [Actinomyces sp.]MDO4242963.1 TadE/TadG family type IV pilus assembly protein [Actinomyces sp.]
MQTIELAVFVPLLVMITILMVQAFMAVATVTSVEAAARDGARAGMNGQSVNAAVAAALPDWVVVQSVTRPCASSTCVRVTARIPIGMPLLTNESVTVSRTAYFPEG